MQSVEQFPPDDGTDGPQPSACAAPARRGEPLPDAPLGNRLLTELLAATAAQAGLGADAAAAARIKSTVLQRIAAGPCGLTVQAEEGDWLPIWDGVQCKVLHVHAPNELSCLLRFAPGAWLPAHRHPVAEECIVLRGVVRVGEAVHVREGGYHLVQAGDLHARVGSDTGALIYLRGPMPEIGLSI